MNTKDPNDWEDSESWRPTFPLEKPTPDSPLACAEIQCQGVRANNVLKYALT